MGLLSHIEGGLNNSPSVHEISAGLLAKTEKLMGAGKISFSAFIKENGISRCAVFSPADNYYVITHSFGLDLNSLISSKSTKDFWKGITEDEDRWYDFYSLDHSVNVLLQLFSDNIKDLTSEINVCMHNEKILLVIKEKDERLEMDSIFENFKTLVFDPEVYVPEYKEISNPIENIFKLDFSNFFKLTSITLILSEKSFIYVRQNMKNEIIRWIFSAFLENSEIYFNEDICQIKLYTLNPLSADLFIAHLKKASISFFGKAWEDIKLVL